MLIFKKYGKGTQKVREKYGKSTEKVRIRTIERNVSFLYNGNIGS